MRVLYLSNNYPSAVIPRRGLWIEGLVRHSQDRWDSCVIAPVPYCPPIPFLSENYTRFRRVPKSERTGKTAVLHPRAVTPPGGRFRRLEGDWLLACVEPRLTAIVGEFPFDIIHAHFTYPDGWVAAKLGKRLGVPVVITEHASWRGWASGQPQILRRAKWAVEHCAAHVSVGTALRDEIGDIIGDQGRLHVIPLGVDDTVFTLPPGSVEKVAHQLLFVGAVRPVKGLDILLEAMAILARRGRQETLMVVGDSFFSAYAKAWSDAEVQVRELRLEQRVTFLGGMEPKGVARVMQQSAVLVSPSRRETLGMVMIEALACGTPVVATQSGGSADIITPEVGRLVPVEDPQALAQAIAEMVDARTTFRAERLRAHALAKFGWPQVTDSYLELYRGILVST